MAEINWTGEAVQWLREIHDYIAQDSPGAATRTIEAIHKKVQMLQEFPELGHRYHDRPDRNIRILLYGHYRIAYRIKEDRNVDILGVFHGALDMDKYLL